jgi:hypothetical protein
MSAGLRGVGPRGDGMMGEARGSDAEEWWRRWEVRVGVGEIGECGPGGISGLVWTTGGVGSLGRASARSTKPPRKARTLPMVDSLSLAKVSSLEVVVVKKAPRASRLRSLSARSVEDMESRTRRPVKVASIHVWSISRSCISMPAISAPHRVNAVNARKRASHTSACQAFMPRAGKSEKSARRSEALRTGAGVRSRKEARMSKPAARKEEGASAAQSAARTGVSEYSWTVDALARAAERERAVESEGTAGGVKAAMSSSTERAGSGAVGGFDGGGSLRRRQGKLENVLVLERPRARNGGSSS